MKFMKNEKNGIMLGLNAEIILHWVWLLNIMNFYFSGLKHYLIMHYFYGKWYKWIPKNV